MLSGTSLMEESLKSGCSLSFFTDAEGCFALEGVAACLTYGIFSFFAVFSVSDDSDSGEFVVLVNQLGLSTSCSNFLKKLLQNSKSSQKLPQNPKVAQKLLFSVRD